MEVEPDIIFEFLVDIATPDVDKFVDEVLIFWVFDLLRVVDFVQEEGFVSGHDLVDVISHEIDEEFADDFGVEFLAPFEFLAP